MPAVPGYLRAGKVWFREKVLKQAGPATRQAYQSAGEYSTQVCLPYHQPHGTRLLSHLTFLLAAQKSCVNQSLHTYIHIRTHGCTNPPVFSTFPSTHRLTLTRTRTVYQGMEWVDANVVQPAHPHINALQAWLTANVYVHLRPHVEKASTWLHGTHSYRFIHTLYMFKGWR